MRKSIALLSFCVITVALFAVPARPGWQTRTQADGSVVEIQQLGDEFYHYMINKEGKEVRLNEFGNYEVVGEAPSAGVAKARRAASQARRQRQAVGAPNLAPRGLVVLANFSDVKFNSANTKAVMDSLLNAKDCQVNNGFGSAAQYFSDQSYGQYEPVFDVYGPVTLSKTQAYYGRNVDEYRNPKEDGDDEYATDAVIEACILANEKYPDLNFANYNANKDSYVDFVYVIYAGKGEADGGGSSTIWPHNYSIQTIVAYAEYGYSKYSRTDTKLDGIYLDNYACSGELNGQDSKLNGNGVFCHEFGHVIGLPDFYDTSYGYNYSNSLTPNGWDVMDAGSYNGNSHCPPNYSAWERYFFGWIEPKNLGSRGDALTLYPSGTEQYNVYQINTSGKLQSATTSGLNYYIENRQQQSWDTYLPGHGLLIWKVNYSSSAWQNNMPNHSQTSGSPLYTVVSASGTEIGTGKNPFPGTARVTSWNGVSDKPLLNIAEKNKLITLIYIDKPIDPFDVVWKANGETFAVTQCPGLAVLPADKPEACSDRKVFVGWCSSPDYSSATTAPTFVKDSDEVKEGDVFYAVFATQNGDPDAVISDTLTLASTGISGTDYEAWGNVTLTSDAVYTGFSGGNNNAIQLRSLSSNSGVVSTTSGGVLKKVEVEWNDKTEEGRTLDVYVKNNPYAAATDLYSASTRGGKYGSIVKGTSTELTFSGDYPYVGLRSNNRVMYVNAIIITWGEAITYSDYSTDCSDEQHLENKTVDQPTAVKAIRDGRLVIIRGEAIYDITGTRIR